MKKSIKFTSKNNQELSGVLHTPDVVDTIAYALFAHCFTCTKDINAATNIATVLAEQGIATLRFDFAGLGASEGEFSETSFSTNVEDLMSAAAFLSENYEAPQLLIGHSVIWLLQNNFIISGYRLIKLSLHVTSCCLFHSNLSGINRR